MPRCVECGRVFDMFDALDAEEWTYGHDCGPGAAAWAAARKAAAAAGRDHGTAAGSWADFRDAAAAGRFLEMWDDGDPVVSMMIPGAPLSPSGEWVGAYRLADLAAECEWPEDRAGFDDLCCVYEDAYADAAADEVVRVARAGVDR